MNFEFLRTHPIDISRYLPKFLAKDKTFADLLNTFSWEHEKQRLFLQELGKQFFVPTATWGIRDWERIVDVTPDAGDTYEQRRNRVLLKLNGRQTSTLDFMGRLISRYIDGDGGHIQEHNEKNTFTIILEGNIKDKKGLDEALDTYKPAHLGYDYRFYTTDRDLHDEPIGDGDGLLTKGGTLDISVRSWFRDDVPYGRSLNYRNTMARYKSVTCIASETSRPMVLTSSARCFRIRFNCKKELTGSSSPTGPISSMVRTSSMAPSSQTANGLGAYSTTTLWMNCPSSSSPCAGRMERQS